MLRPAAPGRQRRKRNAGTLGVAAGRLVRDLHRLAAVRARQSRWQPAARRDGECLTWEGKAPVSGAELGQEVLSRTFS
jgi:hypothetical protein